MNKKNLISESYNEAFHLNFSILGRLLHKFC